jgi:hypothetical protein
MLLLHESERYNSDKSDFDINSVIKLETTDSLIIHIFYH